MTNIKLRAEIWTDDELVFQIELENSDGNLENIKEGVYANFDTIIKKAHIKLSEIFNG